MSKAPDIVAQAPRSSSDPGNRAEDREGGDVASMEFHFADACSVDEASWNHLFELSRTPNLFWNYEVLKSARDVWESLSGMRIACGYSDGVLSFLMPVIEHRSTKGTTLEVLKIPTADNNEPLAPANDWENASRQFVRYLLANPDVEALTCRLVTARFLDILRDEPDIAQVIVENRRSASVLKLPSSIDEYWSGFKSKTRNQLRRKLRKATENGLSFHVTSSRDAVDRLKLEHALERVTHLHRLRFDALDRRSFFVDEEIQHFHQTIVRLPPMNALEILFTECRLDDAVVGSMYGWRSGDNYVFLMIGFDPKLASLSIGTLLILTTIEHAIEQGVSRFDFKCGNESYKKRFTKDQYESYDLTVHLTRKAGLFSRLLSKWIRFR